MKISLHKNWKNFKYSQFFNHEVNELVFAGRTFTCVNILRLSCKWYMFLRFSITCSVLKIKCEAYIVRLQRQSKKLRYIIIYWENRLQCALILLHYVKHVEIDIHQWNVLQRAYYIIWCAYFFHIYRGTQKNSSTVLAYEQYML